MIVLKDLIRMEVGLISQTAVRALNILTDIIQAFLSMTNTR